MNNALAERPRVLGATQTKRSPNSDCPTYVCEWIARKRAATNA
jgi:hypothetical protein